MSEQSRGFKSTISAKHGSTFSFNNITGARECSPVLTATHHFNGRFCDFLLFLFSKTPGGQTPQLIATQNGLNDADLGKDVHFAVKVESFCTV